MKHQEAFDAPNEVFNTTSLLVYSRVRCFLEWPTPGCSDKAMDTLSHHPCIPSCASESETDSDEMEVISYLSVCEAADQCLNNLEIPKDLKQEAQDICSAVQLIIDEEDKNKNASPLNAASIFEHVTPENDGGAAKRSNTQTGILTGHSMREAKNICYCQNKT